MTAPINVVKLCTSIDHVARNAFDKLAHHARIIAKYEGFDAHAQCGVADACEIREELNQSPAALCAGGALDHSRFFEVYFRCSMTG
jgi:hypothetical protein